MMATHPATKREILMQWAAAAEYLLDDLSASEATAEQVRHFMLEWLNAPQELRNINNRKHWKPLTVAQKQAALTEVFPDGQAYSVPMKTDSEPN